MTVETRRTPGYYGAAVEAWVVDRYDLDRTYRRGYLGACPACGSAKTSSQFRPDDTEGER